MLKLYIGLLLILLLPGCEAMREAAEKAKAERLWRQEHCEVIDVDTDMTIMPLPVTTIVNGTARTTITMVPQWITTTTYSCDDGTVFTK